MSKEDRQERIQVLVSEISKWRDRDPDYAAMVQEELLDLYEQMDEEYTYQKVIECGFDPDDYDEISFVPYTAEQIKQSDEVEDIQKDNLQSNDDSRKLDQIHKALFNNPNKTSEQKEQEIVEQMKAKKIMQGVQRRNKGK